MYLDYFICPLLIFLNPWRDSPSLPCCTWTALIQGHCGFCKRFSVCTCRWRRVRYISAQAKASKTTLSDIISLNVLWDPFPWAPFQLNPGTQGTFTPLLFCQLGFTSFTSLSPSWFTSPTPKSCMCAMCMCTCTHEQV